MVLGFDGHIVAVFTFVTRAVACAVVALSKGSFVWNDFELPFIDSTLSFDQLSAPVIFYDRMVLAKHHVVFPFE